MPGDQPARIGLHQRQFVTWIVAVHGADHAALVNDLGQLGEQLAHFDAALAVFAELER